MLQDTKKCILKLRTNTETLERLADNPGLFENFDRLIIYRFESIVMHCFTASINLVSVVSGIRYLKLSYCSELMK